MMNFIKDQVGPIIGVIVLGAGIVMAWADGNRRIIFLESQIERTVDRDIYLNSQEAITTKLNEINAGIQKLTTHITDIEISFAAEKSMTRTTLTGISKDIEAMEERLKGHTHPELLNQRSNN